MKPMTAGIRDLKTHASELLRKVQAGRVVIITNRGKPVAHISPPPPVPRTHEEIVADLVRKGWIDPPPAGKRRPLPPLIQVPMGLAQRYLREDRDARG